MIFIIFSQLKALLIFIKLMKNVVNPDQLASSDQKPADLGLHCFQKRIENFKI